VKIGATTTKPVIGVSTGLRPIEGPFGTQPTHAVSELYSAAVEHAGGIPVVLPALPPGDVPALVERLDGLVLTGGGDVDPELHGRSRHESLANVDVRRDRFEIRLVHEARDVRLPVLAVCRGAQVVNVALGGDLVVDIPSEVSGAVPHRRREVGDPVATHAVRLAPDSCLARLLGTTGVVVTSSHHQAARTVGSGLRAVGWSDDGVVEAVEHQDADWTLLAVQWHPELRDPDNEASWRPFEGVVDAARRRLALATRARPR
jgi:putative glutamine amidotransferase